MSSRIFSWRRVVSGAFAPVALAAMGSGALAHPGPHTDGPAATIEHFLTSLDHVLGIVAVGFCGVALGWRLIAACRHTLVR